MLVGACYVLQGLTNVYPGSPTNRPMLHPSISPVLCIFIAKKREKDYVISAVVYFFIASNPFFNIHCFLICYSDPNKISFQLKVCILYLIFKKLNMSVMSI